MKTILITNSYKKEVFDIIKPLVPEGYKLIQLDKAHRAELLEKAGLADYFIVSGRLKIDKEVLEAAPNLKMVLRTGAGIDQIDKEALEVRNIPLKVNKGVNAKAVAEHTLLLILASLRKLTQADQMLRKGIWKKQEFGVQTRTLFGKTVGILGMGNIGTELVHLLKPFNVRILYFKRNRLEGKLEEQLGIEYCEFEDLLKKSDVLCLLCALNNETEKIINKSSFEKMKNDAVLINTGRGKLIDQKDLIAHLANNDLFSAGLDVFEEEPLKFDDEIIQCLNTTISPHVAGISQESFLKMYNKVFSNF